jgi:hypothetical protein
MQNERAASADLSGAMLGLTTADIEGALASGTYTAECYGPDGALKWRDTIENVWVSQGMEAVLTHVLKGSSYTAANFLGLIEDTGYGFSGANGSGVARTNLAGSITAAGGASPANGWNEAPSSTATPRGTPSFGSASSSGVNTDLALSASVSFSILATDTIKGCFMLIRSAAGTAPTSAVGNTNGALLSAGLFTGGDKAVGNGDTLNVSYTARLTTS